MLLKHPGSDTKPFCLWEKFVLALRLWSIIPQYIRHRIGLIVSGLRFSILFGSIPGFGISIVLFSFQLLGCLWVIRRRLKRSLSASLVSLWLMCFFSIPSGPGRFHFSFCLDAFWFPFAWSHRGFALLIVRLYYDHSDQMVWQSLGFQPTVLYKKSISVGLSISTGSSSQCIPSHIFG